MSFIATVCEKCERLALVPATRLREPAPTCPECAGALREIHNCNYAAKDRALFAELSEIVVEGEVSTQEARWFAEAIADSIRRGSYREPFDALSLRLSGLTPLRLVMGDNTQVQQRALSMLKTIFDARALMLRPVTASCSASVQAASR